MEFQFAYESSKYLELIIDSKLLFKEQVNEIESETARSVGILSKLKKIFPQKNLLQLYSALIHPLLLYGIIIWGSSYPSYLKKLKTLQNKAVRIITGSHFRDSAIPIYNSINILQIDELHTFEFAKLMYQNNQGKLPSPFNNIFIKTNKIFKRSTRQYTSNNFYISRFCSNRLQRCMRHQGVKMWNSTPKEFKSLSFKVFKSRYKNHLISFGLK